MKVSTRGIRSERHLRLAVLAVAVIAIDARAELVEIAWDKAGRFETAVSVAPGKFAEVCSKLAQGQSIAWSFKGDRPMNFNIHYHEGKQVVFPTSQFDGMPIAPAPTRTSPAGRSYWSTSSSSAGCG